jgi:hypothetical protein
VRRNALEGALAGSGSLRGRATAEAHSLKQRLTSGELNRLHGCTDKIKLFAEDVGLRRSADGEFSVGATRRATVCRMHDQKVLRRVQMARPGCQKDGSPLTECACTAVRGRKNAPTLSGMSGLLTPVYFTLNHNALYMLDSI